MPSSVVSYPSSVLCRLVAVVGLLAGALSGTLQADAVVFRDGAARLPIYVGAQASADERWAAEELARVLGRMSGFDWSVSTEPTGQRAGIYVGHTRRAAAVLPALRRARDLLAPAADEVGPDGFRIRTLHGSVFIEGVTPEATPFAVSWLLQRAAGVRWYAPGPLGEVIPSRAEWVLPELAVVREPAYVSREISGLRGEAGRDWSRRNGLRQRLEYSHNLTRLFTPELYDAHPEWFAEFEGARRRPNGGGGDFFWQPDLASPAVAAYAAEQAAAAFARDPGRGCFSLGMNDAVRFDQSAETQALVAPLRYFRGMPDYSPLIFTFMNRAAAELDRRPEPGGRYLGCLAYFWAEDVPPFEMNPRVVPYVTTDRSQFYDPAYRAADYALMSRWGHSGVKAFGLWEYAEGNAFVIPRSAHGAIAGAIHEGWWRGARGYMGECGPHAGFDAFKVWMMAQLLWESDRPLEELKRDFFDGWYGPAAEPMRRFFDRCEAVWLAQPGPPWWIKFYQQQDQVLLFSPEVCTELRGILAEAERRAEGSGPSLEDRGQRTDDGGRTADNGSDLSGNQEIRNGGRRADDGGLMNDDRERITDGECGNQEGADGGRSRLAGDLGNDGGVVRTQGPTLQSDPKPCSAAAPASCILPPASSSSSSLLDSRYSDRVALTSRAFAVTETAVTFDAARRSLLAPEAERWGAAQLGRRLVELQRARLVLETAITAATTGETPAMATANIGYLLRNDPVPSVLSALGQRDPVGPMTALGELVAAGMPVPAHWTALAAACAQTRDMGGVNLLANPLFLRVSPDGQAPRFLYPLSGEVPQDWELRAIATEKSCVALGKLEDGARPLRIEGAWDTQLLQRRPATVGRLYLAEIELRGVSSPGNDASLILTFLDAHGRNVGEFRTVSLPKGRSDWRLLALADTAPVGSVQVVFGIVAKRQFGGDWLEARLPALRAVGR